MSHSDSEVNKRRRGERKRNLHVVLKPQSNQYSALKRRMKVLRDARLLFAASKNNTEAVNIQLALGASPDTSDDHGRSALHIAASKGYSDVVKILLARGADPNQSDKLFNTPLHLAACTHNLPIISMLVKAGADVRKLDLYGKNPLQLAESKLQLLQRSWREGSIEMVQVKTELKLIIDMLIMSQKSEVNVGDLEFMKLTLNSEPAEIIDDQMSKLLSELQGFKIT